MSIFLSLGSSAQQQAYQINYTIVLSDQVREILKDEATLTDPNIQFLEAISGAFDENNPVLEAWTNEDYFKIKSHLFEPLTQITHREQQQTFHLFAEDSTYIVEEYPAATSIWHESIEFIPGKTQEIAGYQAKLAVLNIDEQEKIEIWYTQELPAFSWGEYAYLQDIPGAALRISAAGINFQAIKISKKDNLAADFFQIPTKFEQITPEQHAENISSKIQDEYQDTTEHEEELSEGMIAYFDKESSLYGLKTETGDIVSKPAFSTLGSFINGQSIAYNEEYLAGIIDKEGHNIIPFEYSYLVYEPEWEAYIYAKDDFMGLVNKKGEIDPNHRYDNLSSLSEGYAMYAVNGKYGLLNKQLEVVVPATYDYIIQYNDTYFIVSEDFESKVIAIESNEVVLAGFTDLYLAGDEKNIFIASQDAEYYGYVNIAGETVIPFKYSYVSPFVNGKALVSLADSEEFITINPKGEIIEQPTDKIDE